MQRNQYQQDQRYLIVNLDDCKPNSDQCLKCTHQPGDQAGAARCYEDARKPEQLGMATEKFFPPHGGEPFAVDADVDHRE